MSASIFVMAASTAFNLSCVGTLETESFYNGKTSEAYSYSYRIDLEAGRYCESSCKAIHTIYEVQPAYIVLEAPEDIDTPTLKRFFRTSIDRETGVQSTLMTSGRRQDILIMKWTGQCAKQPFSGFPTLETKF